MTGIGSKTVEAYLRRAIGGDGRAGVRLALDLIDNGVPSNDVIVDLLGQAQREIGERWLANYWTVADEHLVSGVSQKALNAVANATELPAPTGFVVMACPEGDWHSLPAQMFAEMLRGRGFAVAFLGASTPVDHVAALLSRQRPDALAVSCSLAPFFGGVIRLTDAAHRLNVPVIAGGGALGHGPGRAIRLGADAWAAEIDDAVTILRDWQHGPPVVSAQPTSLNPATVHLAASAAGIASEAFGSLSVGYPPLASCNDNQRALIEESLAYVTQSTAAARLVADRTVLSEVLVGLGTLLVSRGVPSMALDAGLEALVPIIGRTDPEAAQLALDAIRDETAPRADGRRTT